MRIVADPVTLESGLSGTEQLLEYITRLINEGARRADVRQLALEVVANARPQDSSAEIQAVWDYLTRISAPPYRMDPVDLQLLTWPEAIRTLKAYDCKKITIVAGALLQALGHPVKVRVIDQRPQQRERGADYHHVYLRVLNKDTGQWVTFDPVARSWRHPAATVGSELQHQARRTYMIRPATQYRNGYTTDGRPVMGFSLYDALGIKHIDPTRPENTALRSILSFTPLAPLVTAADAAAVANKVVKAATAAPPAPPKPAPLAVQTPAKPTTPVVQTPQQLTQATSKPMSTGAKVAIGVGAAAGVGLLVYALTRKPKRRANPGKRRTSRRRKAA